MTAQIKLRQAWLIVFSDVKTFIISIVLGRRLDRRARQTWHWVSTKHQRFKSKCFFKSIFKVIKRTNNLIFPSYLTFSLTLLEPRDAFWLIVSLPIFAFPQIHTRKTQKHFTSEQIQFILLIDQNEPKARPSRSSLKSEAICFYLRLHQKRVVVHQFHPFHTIHSKNRQQGKRKILRTVLNVACVSCFWSFLFANLTINWKFRKHMMILSFFSCCDSNPRR